MMKWPCKAFGKGWYFQQMTGSNKVVLYFTAYIKVNSEWAADLHVKNKTIKFPENDTEYPHDLEIGKKKIQRNTNDINRKGKD